MTVDLQTQIADLRLKAKDQADAGRQFKADELTAQADKLQSKLNDSDRAASAILPSETRQAEIDKLELRHKKHVDSGEDHDAIQVRIAINRLKQVPIPQRVKLVSPHGFYTMTNELRYWNQGQETRDPDVIELLIARGANLQDVSDEKLPE